jgi:hypothetical protein
LNPAISYPIGAVGCNLRFGRHGLGMLLRTRVSREGVRGGGSIPGKAMNVREIKRFEKP